MDRVFGSVMKCCALAIEESIGLHLKPLPQSHGTRSAGSTLVVIPLNFVDENAQEDDDDEDTMRSHIDESRPPSDAASLRIAELERQLAEARAAAIPSSAASNPRASPVGHPNSSHVDDGCEGQAA